MFEVRVHGSLWGAASPARAAEWRRAIAEFNADNAVASDSIAPAPGAAIELVRPPGGFFHVRIYGDPNELVATVPLEPPTVEAHFREYAETIRHLRRLDLEAPVRGIEAVDYAKRVVHDEAGDYLRKALRPWVTVSVDDARRLFTLLFLVGSDLPDDALGFHRRH
jgi:hypothetical protein